MKKAIDWNVWHEPFLDAVGQIDWSKCANVLSGLKENKEEVYPGEMIEEAESLLISAVKYMEKEKAETAFSAGAHIHVQAWAPNPNDKEEPDPVVEIKIVLDMSLH